MPARTLDATTAVREDSHDDVQIGFLELEERDAAEAIDAVRPALV